MIEHPRHLIAAGADAPRGLLDRGVLERASATSALSLTAISGVRKS